jgi:hypothetical protein
MHTLHEDTPDNYVHGMQLNNTYQSDNYVHGVQLNNTYQSEKCYKQK